MKITSEITTNMTTVIASVSSRATARQQDVHIEIIWQSSHTLHYYIRSGIGKLHVDKADGIFLFLVDDFGVYLGGLHIRMAE